MQFAEPRAHPTDDQSQAGGYLRAREHGRANHRPAAPLGDIGIGTAWRHGGEVGLAQDGRHRLAFAAHPYEIVLNPNAMDSGQSRAETLSADTWITWRPAWLQKGRRALWAGMFSEALALS